MYELAEDAWPYLALVNPINREKFLLSGKSIYLALTTSTWSSHQDCIHCRVTETAEEEDAELTNPHKHIRNTSAPGAPITENKDWQKDSYTINAIRKIHTELGRKRKETIRLGPALLRGDTEEEEDCMVLEILT